jgi:hypothetical protein
MSKGRTRTQVERPYIIRELSVNLTSKFRTDHGNCMAVSTSRTWTLDANETI